MTCTGKKTSALERKLEMSGLDLPPHDVLPLPDVVRLQVRKQAVPDRRRRVMVLVHKVHQVLRRVVLLQGQASLKSKGEREKHTPTCRRFGLNVDTMRAVVFQASACDRRFWASLKFL
jgi:hypothetical protein